MNEKLTVGSCFSGIGGLELGLEWTGQFETKWQIEWDDYASRVLAKHWPNVQRFSDITAVYSPPRVDVICGGFPCQDVSLAGARAGLEGNRSTLWGEMFRLVCEIRPQWVVAENVPGLLSSDDGRFFGNILRDLASAGYDAEWGVLSAAGVGAPHLRRRVFILANARCEHGQTGAEITGGLRGLQADGETRHLTERPGAVANPNFERLEGPGPEQQTTGIDQCFRRDWWTVEPDVGRVAHGVPKRMERLKCLGNAVVPQVAQRIGEMILKFKRQSGAA